ncbi:uncharacterized protein LOC111086704 [Limulus polyphemus]|uniref:Uncharacterized protein LOC111086704 n=1 Tax=Limulus polyphemus TaxID=6850 RepID=A0ABM1SRQ2_LIMPO|nr:uncharacterized protein LOC111086704 [Limulus polyphemus]
MSSDNIIKHPSENVPGLNENSEVETVLRSDNKSLNDSHQTSTGVTRESFTSQCKQMSCFKSEMNRILDTDFHHKFTKCNPELPQQSSSVFTPNSSLSKPPMLDTKGREKLNIANDSKHLTKLANQLQLKEHSTLSQERNNNSQTSQRTISILKTTSNNSILSDCVLECPACNQSSIRHKLSSRELVSEDMNVSKRESVFPNSVNSEDSSCRLDNVDSRNSIQEDRKSISGRTPQYSRNISTLKLCKKCEIHKTDKESKQYEDYYSSLRETKSRKRPADLNGCRYCEKQPNRYSSTKSKIKSRSWNARKLDNCSIFFNEPTMVNLVDSKCKDREHHSHESSAKCIREMENDIVFDIHPASGTNQERVLYRYPCATLRCSKECQKPDVHMRRCVCGYRESTKSRNQWSDTLSHCSCSYHTDRNDGHYCHAKFDKRKRRNINKLGPRLEDKGVGTESQRHGIDYTSILLEPSILRMDYMRRNEDENSLPSIEDILAYRRFQTDTQIQHVNSPFQVSQTQDFYRSYPCLDVENARDFLHRKHLRKRRKRALFMGVMAICIVLVVGITVAVVFTSIRHKHYNFT